MNFVTADLIGRLGNAMFQIAATVSYASDNNLLPKFSKLKSKPYKNYKKNIFRNLNTEEINRSLMNLNTSNQPLNIQKYQHKNVLLKGHYQSEKFL